jgi:hypothetical protein
MSVAHKVTRNELVEIFSRYGRVLHAVILATSDNASRRRGFIVMSTHGEAHLALNSLSRTEVKWVFSSVTWQRLFTAPFAEVMSLMSLGLWSRGLKVNWLLLIAGWEVLMCKRRRFLGWRRP